MNTPEIIIVTVLAVTVVAIIIYLVWRKKHHGSCCSGCSNCPMNGKCGSRDSEKSNKKDG